MKFRADGDGKGVVFYLVSFYLIASRYAGERGDFDLDRDWYNTNCITHGAMSITGLASVVCGSADLLQAIIILRDVNAAGKRTLPEEIPTSFVRPRWQPYVMPSGLPLDRRYYELCVLSELRDRLRAGDIWVAGSRQYKNFETYLIPATTFQKMRMEPLPLAIDIWLTQVLG